MFLFVYILEKAYSRYGIILYSVSFRQGTQRCRKVCLQWDVLLYTLFVYILLVLHFTSANRTVVPGTLHCMVSTKAALIRLSFSQALKQEQ